MQCSFLGMVAVVAVGWPSISRFIRTDRCARTRYSELALDRTVPPCAKRSTKLSIQSSFHKLGRSSSVGLRIIQSALREWAYRIGCKEGAGPSRRHSHEEPAFPAFVVQLAPHDGGWHSKTTEHPYGEGSQDA